MKNSGYWSNLWPCDLTTSCSSLRFLWIWLTSMILRLRPKLVYIYASTYAFYKEINLNLSIVLFPHKDKHHLMSDIYCTPTKPYIFNVPVHTLASSSAVSLDKVSKNKRKSCSNILLTLNMETAPRLHIKLELYFIHDIISCFIFSKQVSRTCVCIECNVLKKNGG